MHSTQSEVHQSEVDRVNAGKGTEHRTQSEVHKSEEYPTYLHLGISIFLFKTGTSTNAIDQECNPFRGLAWSSARTRGKVANFRRDAQPFAWIGVIERPNAR